MDLLSFRLDDWLVDSPGDGEIGKLCDGDIGIGGMRYAFGFVRLVCGGAEGVGKLDNRTTGNPCQQPACFWPACHPYKLRRLWCDTEDQSKPQRYGIER